MGRIHGALIGALWIMNALPLPLAAQRRVPGSSIEAYHAAVGRAFPVSADEVGILAEWQLRPAEIVVVLFVAGRAGVSPDAVASLRSSGGRWADVLRRYSVDPGALWISFPAGTDLGPLESTYRTFSETPRASWASIDLSDQVVIALVNIRILAREAGVSTARVLRAWESVGDFVLVHQRITR